jgi:hypothetical protein
MKTNVSLFEHTVDVNRFVRADGKTPELGLVDGNTTSTVGHQPDPEHVHEAWADMVSLENDLRGQNKSTSKCASLQYIPDKNVIRDTSNRHKDNLIMPVNKPAHLAVFEFVDYSNLEEAFKGLH